MLAIVRSVVGSRDKYVRDSCVRARQRGVTASLSAPPSRARGRQARERVCQLAHRCVEADRRVGGAFWKERRARISGPLLQQVRTSTSLVHIKGAAELHRATRMAVG